MHVVLIAWLYVAGLMALAEASGPDGTLLGALITFVLYGVLPLSIVMYILGSPARRRALRRQEALSHIDPAPEASTPNPPTAEADSDHHRGA